MARGAIPRNRQFGRLLRETRKRKGRTMLELAEPLGISVVYVSDVERGNRAPWSNVRIEKAAGVLKCDEDETSRLIVAAANSRGAFELSAEGVSEKAREVGAALMRGWADLDDGDLDQIASVVGRKRRRGRR